MLNNSPQMHLKLLQKDQFNKPQKQPVILLEIKPLIKLQKSQEIHQRIVQRQLQMTKKILIMIKKYLKKDVYLKKNLYLNQLFDSSFQGLNKRFVLSLENNAHRTNYKRYFLPTAEIKNTLL